MNKDKGKVDELGPHKVLIVTVGLPYSGKSTWAKESGYPVVNPDSVRVALHGKRFIKEAEPFVWATVKCMVRALFLSGHDVVVLDATNTTHERRKEWMSEEWHTDFVIFGATAEECIQRAKVNGDIDILPVIVRMDKYKEFSDDV